MGPVVAVVGGGQLARMMAEAAGGLQIQLRALVEAPDSSAAQVIPASHVGAPDDAAALAALAAGADALTFEHEHVPAPLLQALIEEGISVQPGPGALACAQDKIHMRTALSRIGAPCPRWRVARSLQDVREFGEDVGWPIVAKTPTGGYDGKGVLIVPEPFSGEVEHPSPYTAVGGWLERGEVLLEEKVAFRRELAALVARRPSGQIVAWPVAQTVQRGGVCAEVISPAPDLDPGLACRALETAQSIARGLDVTGVLAVELFEGPDGGVLVNELAMRPHNSGHITIDASRTSQFEQHLRAVLDLPLGAAEQTAPWGVMVNLLGSGLADPSVAYPEVMRRYPEAKIHLYGKSVRPGRKLGHVSIAGEDLERCLARARAAVALLRGD